MFNETHLSKETNGILLAFIKSLNVQAYPCGRRRSELVDGDGREGTVDDKYYIPFDPEARLNTEFNNRNHSGINGFTQNFINKFDSENHLLSLVLAGYLFNIRLDAGYSTIADFGSVLSRKLNILDNDVVSIYANIRIEETPLFSGFTTYTTKILRDQSMSASAEINLDLLNSEVKNSNDASIQDKQDINNYYFSGLSFSARPLATATEPNDSNIPYIIENTTANSLKQQVISLRIMDKVPGGVWKLHQRALLPKILHGGKEDSIVVDDIDVNTITSDRITTNDIRISYISDKEQNISEMSSIPVVKVKETDTSNVYRLHFFNTNKQ
jgi:hypothetical protein